MERYEMNVERDGGGMWWVCPNKTDRGDWVKWDDVGDDVEKLEESRDLLLHSLKSAFKFIESITDALGPYTYVNGTGLVYDAYNELRGIRETIGQVNGE